MATAVAEKQHTWREFFVSPTPYSLNRNCPARVDDTSHIRNAIAAANEAIIDLNRIILEQSQVLQDLIRYGEAVESFRDDHARTMSSIRRVPPELWLEIFKNACAPFIMERPSLKRLADLTHDSVHPDNPIWTIDRVCVGWHDILRSCPQMWTQCLLKQSCTIIGVYDNLAVNHILRSLEYSKDQPFHVTFDLRGITLPAPWKIMRYMDVFVSHRHRLESINLYDGRETKVAKAFFDCISSHEVVEFPAVKDFRIVLTYRITVAFPNLISNFPHLRQVRFGGLCPPVDSLPWSQLDCVRLELISSRQFAPVLRELVRATALCVSYEGDDVEVNPMTYTLPCLKLLDINSPWEPKVFTNVKMPKLSVLHIHTTRIDDIPSLIDFIQQSQSRIVKFNCTRCYAGPNDKLAIITSFSALLASLPHLTHLRIGKTLGTVENDSALLQLLGEKSDADGFPIYCPALRTLSLPDECWMGVLQDETIVMLNVRQAGRCSSAESHVAPMGIEGWRAQLA